MWRKGTTGTENTVTPCVSLCRVRLVERGSPHSLPLMESGKVSIEGRRIRVHINMSLSLWALKIQEIDGRFFFFKNVFLNVVYQDWFWP